MATVAQNGLDPDQNQQNTGGSGTVMNSTSGGGGVSSGGAAPSGGASTAPRANPGGAPNVQDYLNANQGAGQRLSTGITNNVQNQANQVTSQANTYGNQLNSQYNPINQTLSGGQAAANTAFQDPQALLTAYQNAQSQNNPTPGTTPTAPNAGDLANYNAFQGDITGTNQYNQNQQQIQNYNNAGQQANNSLQTQLGALGQATGSAANEMGRNQLLQQTVGNPNYNQGQQTLDSLFLQGQAPQLQQNLGNIQNTTANTVNTQNTDYQNKLSALQGLSSGNNAYATNLFLNGPGSSAGAPTGTGLNAIGNNVANEYTAAQTAAAAPGSPTGTNYASLQAAAALNGGKGQFTTQQLAELGITPGTQAWGIGLGNDITQGILSNTGAAGTAANATGNAQVANAAEFARYNALNQLAGGPSGALQNNIFGSATAAGGYNPVNFNNAGFTTAVNNAQQALGPQGASAALTNMNGNVDYSGVISTIQAGLANGSMTPQQANALIQQRQATINSNYTNAQNNGGATINWGSVNSELAPWTNYYNQYNNAAGDVLGPSSTQIGNNEFVNTGNQYNPDAGLTNKGPL